MDSYEVTGIKVQDINGLDTNAQPITTKQVTFYVGTQGPFYLRYKPGEYTADKIKADMAREVEVLRAIGATAHTAH